LLNLPGATAPGKPKTHAYFGDGSWAGGTLIEPGEPCQRGTEMGILPFGCKLVDLHNWWLQHLKACNQNFPAKAPSDDNPA
jgi:hypothetical protein